MNDQTNLTPRTGSSGRESVIDEGVVFEGRLTVRGGSPLVIHGTVKGDIVSDGSVTLSESGVVHGVLSARDLDVAGHVVAPEKDIEVRGLLHMRRTGVVQAARVIYGELEHERGARLSGALVPIDVQEVLRSDREPRAVPALLDVRAQAAQPVQQATAPALPPVTRVAVMPARAPQPPVLAQVPAPMVSVQTVHAAPVAVAAGAPAPASFSSREAAPQPMAPAPEPTRFSDTVVGGLDDPFSAQPRVSTRPAPLSGLGDLDMPLSELRPLRATSNE